MQNNDSTIVIRGVVVQQLDQIGVATVCSQNRL